MNQLIPFNPAIAGTVHLECLDNVRKGFGIDNKYGSAWEAWEHTQQHTDPIPEGLDVPLFYSYTANIDGVTQNWGHINVRLKDGTVWSDGTIYANLDAYLYNHYPQYVGWGESVNDFKIIEGVNMNHEQNIELARGLRLMAGESVDEANSHVEDDANHMDADPLYGLALQNQLYNGEWQSLANDATSWRQRPVDAPAPTTPIENPTPAPVFPEIHQPPVQVPTEAKLPNWLQFLVNLINKKG